MNIISKVTGKPSHEIRPQDTIRGDLLIDSVQFIQLVVEMEYAFKTEFGDQDLIPSNFETVDSIVRYLEQKLKN